MKQKTGRWGLSPAFAHHAFLALLGLVGGTAVVSLALATLTIAYRNRVYPHTYIGAVNFGGATRERAKAILVALADRVPDDSKIDVDGETKTTLSLKGAGFAYDVAGTVNDVLAVGRASSLTRSLNELARVAVGGNRRLARFRFDDSQFAGAINEVTTKTNQPARDAVVVLSGNGGPVITPSAVGHGLTAAQIAAAFRANLGTFHYAVELTSQPLRPAVTEDQAAYALAQTKRILLVAPLTFTAGSAKAVVDAGKLFSWLSFALTAAEEAPPIASLSATRPLGTARVAAPTVLISRVDEAKVKDWLISFAGAVNKEPINAAVGAKDGKIVVLTPHQDGRKIKFDEAVAAIIAAAGGGVAAPTIDLPTEIVAAEIQEATIENLGLKELVASGTTSFARSPENRIHNITNGAGFLNGFIVGRNNEFSTIKTLGKIDGSSGYLPELVIKENKTVPDFGGGLCQVSTTLFRAALNAGLPITARQNHSYRVPYYEPPVGLDATIFQNPDVDLKFKNDTPGDLLVQSKIDGTKITFELWGTKDGRESHLTDPVVSDVTDPPPDIRADTDTLPKGTVKQTDHAHPGANATVVYTVTRGGKEINKQTFRSHYVPWPARFLVGTKE